MVASPGYNITCDPGDLYSRKCYTTNSSGVKEEITDWTANGEPISKGQSNVSWLAWIPTLTTLNQDGIAYQPYGEAGIPYTKSGSVVSSYMPSSGADSQDAYYINEVMPGSQARKMYNKRTCSPLWNTFGCKTENGGLQSAPTTEESAKNKSFWQKIFGTEQRAENKMNPLLFVGAGSIIILGCVLLGK